MSRAFVGLIAGGAILAVILVTGVFLLRPRDPLDVAGPQQIPAVPAATGETRNQQPAGPAGMIRPAEDPGNPDVDPFAVSNLSRFEPSPPVVAISPDEFDRAWRFDFDVENTPAGQVIESLAAESGLSLDPTHLHSDKLTKPISVRLKGVNRLQAIDEACRQVGLYPRYDPDFPSTLGLSQGRRRWPVTFAGPFAIVVEDLDEHVPYGRGALKLHVLAVGLPSSLLGAISRSNLEFLEMTRVADSQGRSLVNRIDGLLSGRIDSRSVLFHESTISLKNLFRDVPAVDRLRGTIRLELPSVVETFRFDALAPGTKRSAGAREITLTGHDPGEESELTFDFGRLNAGALQFLCFDAAGRVMDLPYGALSYVDIRQQSIAVNGKPVRVEIRMVAESRPIEFPFELPPIPLASADQMPEKLEPLKFEGASPVTLEFVKVSQDGVLSGVVFNVTNHTNKPIHAFTARIECLNAVGEPLRNELSVQRPVDDPVLVPQGATSEVAFPILILNNTVRATAVVEQIEFVDGTIWDWEDSPPDEESPYIIGHVDLQLQGAAKLHVGYLGISENGESLANSEGFDAVSASSKPMDVTPLSRLPGRTSARILDGANCRFSHTRLKPGTYLVYARWGDRHCDWKWVVVKPGGKHHLKFRIASSDTGTLVADASAKTFANSVELVPLNDDGTLPISDDQVPSLLLFQMGLTAKVENGKATLDGVRPGKYRVKAGIYHKEVTVESRRTVSVSLDAR